MAESIFARFSACYTCGLEENFDFESSSPTMQRASVSRRNLGSQPYVRSRSEERNRKEDGDLADENAKIEKAMLEKTQTMDSDDGLVEEVRKEDGHDATDTEDADEAAPSGERIYRRAMSDPFDTGIPDGDMDEIRQADEQAEAEETARINNTPTSVVTQGYPTLPRYPIAATQNKNCWSAPPISIYSVRGPKYLKDKKKVPSKDYLLSARGCDLFLMENEKLDIFARTAKICNGNLRAAPSMSINFRFPWGSLLLHYEVPAQLAQYIGASKGAVPIPSSFSPAEKVVAKWFMGDTSYKNERLKLIPYVAEGPWVVRNMVTGRPAIIGKRLPVSYNTLPAENGLAPHFQCTLDIGSSSAAAKRIVSVCRRYMSALTVDIGFVIQGDTVDELPEQMLAATRVHAVDPLKAPKL